MTEVIHANGTRPRIIRADRGSTFDCDTFKAWCADEGILYVPGVAHHSQGQGKVETRFRGIAASLIATLGHKAPHLWCEPPHLGNLEGVINSTSVSSLGGSPSWVMFGSEPRTRAAALTDTSSSVMGLPLTPNDLNNIISEHHNAIAAAQQRASLAASLAQAITKRDYDKSTSGPGDYKVDDWFLVHSPAPNRLLPHFKGPYKATSLSPDGNFVTGKHFTDAGSPQGPFHISRLLHFDMSRATPAEIAHFQLEPGSGLVDAVLNHRTLADGTTEFEVRWFASTLTSWLPGSDLKLVTKAISYCSERGLPPPGTPPPRAPQTRGSPRSRTRTPATAQH
jgi:hypothetical protein